MIERLQPDRINRSRQGSTLTKILVGDFAAAAFSATLISPVITVIDRAVVENVAYSNRSLYSLLKTYILFESIGDAVTRGTNHFMVNPITFLSTCIVNVPLGVWKDVRFVQAYGRSAMPATSVLAPATKRGNPGLSIQRPRVSKAVGATFLLRDSTTIFGSFTLPSALTTTLPDSFFSNPATRLAAAQLVVPVFSQILVTPVHLLGLDVYSTPRRTVTAFEAGVRDNKLRERWNRIRMNLGPATLLRCVRIVPSFGIGGLVNTWLRKSLHGKMERNSSG
ncbi:hypothetical protein K458DRAFT_477097 [Lentithecium fluviatile CBS 122367]|uniref:Mitochondrial carrier n=1 Tax=Lentithecium fluviatile CBS 122367 TaxID=1168545 RepID=A0A6G1J6J3_9PLEO|nr:hypothetical protein K458DRAFT_477097 [Lentithecium fluviatile CBS 122367]